MLELVVHGFRVTQLSAATVKYVHHFSDCEARLVSTHFQIFHHVNKIGRRLNE